MYRIIKSSSESTHTDYEMDIEIRFEIPLNIAAAERIILEGDEADTTDVKLETFDTIKQANRFTKEQIEIFEDTIHQILERFKWYGSIITKRYQSTRSYSYYVDVEMQFYNSKKEKYETILVHFRISNHYNEGTFTSLKDKNLKYNIVINDGAFTHEDAIKEVNNICTQLLSGEYPHS